MPIGLSHSKILGENYKPSNFVLSVQHVTKQLVEPMSQVSYSPALCNDIARVFPMAKMASWSPVGFDVLVYLVALNARPLSRGTSLRHSVSAPFGIVFNRETTGSRF